MKEVGDLKRFHVGTVSTYSTRMHLTPEKVTNGPEGTVSKSDPKVREDDL